MSTDGDALPDFLAEFFHERAAERLVVQLAGGRLDGRYRLESVAGEGGFGIVYRAFDERLLRTVAVKLMHPSHERGRAGADALTRWMTEARITAALAHPSIMGIHDVGCVRSLDSEDAAFPEDAATRLRDLPYLVSEWIDGTSIATRRSVPLAKKLDQLAQLADALEHAHALGVIHRDLHPSNIWVDERGRTRVLDFGLATAVREATRGPAGTPGFIAPEQWADGAATARSDLFSLGAVAFLALTGRPAFDAATDPSAQRRPLRVRTLVRDVPSTIDELVDRCLAIDPRDRPVDAAEVARVFRAAVDEPRERVEDTDCPYPGLRAYEVAESSRFFGRDEELALVCERLLESRARWLVVAGASGIGKSSFVAAGVVPLVRAGALGPVDDTSVTTIRFTDQRPAAVLERIGSGVSIVVIDQLEELVTAHEDSAQQEMFVDRLRALLERRQPPWILSSGRSDLLGRLGEAPGMARLLNERAVRFELAPLDPPGLRRAIAGPAAAAGGPLPPDTLSSLLAEHAAGCSLPAIAFALSTLWTATDGRCSPDAYRELGGASGALSSAADRALDALDVSLRGDAEHVLLGLVRIASGSQPARRPQPRAALLGLASSRGAGERVLQALLELGLLTCRREGDEELLELAHDRLCADWPRLAGWIRARRVGLEIRDELESVAHTWARAGRPTEGVARGRTLAYLAQAWCPSSEAKAYLDASRTEAGKTRRERHRRRLRNTAAVGVTGLAFVVLLGWVGFERVRRADDARRASMLEETAQQVAGHLLQRARSGSGDPTSDYRPALVDSSLELLEVLGPNARPEDWVQVTLRRARLAFEHQHVERARELTRAAVKRARELAHARPDDPDAVLLFTGAVSAGVEQFKIVDPGETWAWIEEAIQLLREMSVSRPDDERVRRALVTQLVSLERFHRANGGARARLEAQHEILGLLERTSDVAPQTYASNLARLADINRALGRFGDAEAFYEIAEAMTPAPKNIPDRRARVWLLVSRADLAREAGRYSVAMARLREALELVRANVQQTGDLAMHRADEAAVVLRIASVENDADHPEEAARWALLGLERQQLLPEGNREYYVVRGLRDLGRSALATGDPLGATSYLEDAMVRARAIRGVTTPLHWWGLPATALAYADALVATGRWAEAATVLEEGASVARLAVEVDPDAFWTTLLWVRLVRREAEVSNILGDRRREQGLLERSAPVLDRLLQLHPGDPRIQESWASLP